MQSTTTTGFLHLPSDFLKIEKALLACLTFRLLSAACHILLGQPREAMAEARLATQLEVGNGNGNGMYCVSMHCNVWLLATVNTTDKDIIMQWQREQ